VTLALEAQKDGLQIAISDTGIGIPPEHQQRIFEEFYQVGNPGRTSKKGLGLGLSIVQRMSELLGYRMQVESVPGDGATFRFVVPFGTLPAREATAPSAAPARPSDLTGKLVVVIDDEEQIVEGMKALLSGWGAQVIGSTSGHDVIDAVHALGRLPDLLIVDYRLGNGDIGLDVARQLREELDPEIPAILVTGSITPELGEQARAAQFEFLLKPVLPEKLRASIYIALGQWPAPADMTRAA
jgi:CheY-like chemotaxis protein